MPGLPLRKNGGHNFKRKCKLCHTDGHFQQHHCYGTVDFFDSATGEEQSVLTSPNSQDGGFFGYCLAMDEEFILIGAPLDAAGESSGVVLYLFDLVEGREIQQIFASDLDQNDEFGFAVAWHNNSALTSSRAEGEVPINASG